MKPLVYIAGPYTSPDPCANTHAAIKVADRLLEVCVPVVPHLSHFWHTMSPKPYATWLAYDLNLLHRCNALLRMRGESPGADIEVQKAQHWDIPVFYREDELRAWLPVTT